jgi:hypothetical protein
MFRFPGIKVARINKGPLLSASDWAKLDPNKVIRSITREILKRIRTKIRQEAFSPAAKRALAEGMRVQAGPSSITVIATHPAFRPLLEGQKKGQMKWLKKARVPIPIVTETGELIFRSATPRSMRNGRWVHPGRPNTKIIDRARKEARQVVRERMKEEIARQLRAGFAKKTKRKSR